MEEEEKEKKEKDNYCYGRLGAKKEDTEEEKVGGTSVLNKQNIHGAFNKFPDFFVQAFKIVLDSWKFTMLLLYILWDNSSIFMI